MRLIALLIATSSFAACGTQNEASNAVSLSSNPKPNMFVCQIEGGYNATYTSSSEDGQPHFFIKMPEGQASDLSAVGDQIETEILDDGSKLVSASQNSLDLKTVKYTLSIPELRDFNVNQPANFESTLTILVGPLSDQDAKTSVLKASCQAQRIFF